MHRKSTYSILKVNQKDFLFILIIDSSVFRFKKVSYRRNIPILLKKKSLKPLEKLKQLSFGIF